ncbi:MAG: hypothetical protein KGI60_04850 [Patescibacteria group bacterium]|nr:hypothetical protein [Patescibacteria group bacterium]
MKENIEKKFKKILESNDWKDLDKPAAYYVVEYHDPSLPDGAWFIYERFRSKAARDAWCRNDGRDVLRIHGGEFRMPDKPMTEEEISKEKSGQ